MKLLLVEDDSTTVEYIKICLTIYAPGVILEATDKGLEAISQLEKGDYDGLLLDLGLPDIDGTEIIEKLRPFSQIPVLVISAKDSKEVIAKAFALGADDYIVKPFDNRNFLNRLNKLFNINPKSP